MFLSRPLPYPLHCILTLLPLALTACQPAHTQADRPAALPQADRIQVYTNHNPAATYTEPYRPQIRTGDDLEAQIVGAIASAQSSLDIAVQELRLPKVAQALAERRQAGVQVRVILENTYSRPLSSFSAAEIAKLPKRDQGRFQEFRSLIDRDQDGQISPAEIQQGDALVILDRAHIPRIDDTADGSAGSNLMHHKFIVIDRQRVLVTSANFTTSDIHGDFQSPASRGNANSLLLIDSPELASLFAQEFALMWGDGPGGQPDSKFGSHKPFRPAQTVTVGDTQIQVQFSPAGATVPWTQSTNGLIGKTLESAKTSVEMALFVFSDQALVDQLANVHQRGIPIRVLIHPEFAYRPYSEAFDMWGAVLMDHCQAEPDNRPWNPPLETVGVPRLPPGDMLHHKFGIVDQKVVIMGSHNWTAAANRGNDETVLVIHSPTVAAHFHREFERLYDRAILGMPPAVQKKVKAQQQNCGGPRSPQTVATPNSSGDSSGDSSGSSFDSSSGDSSGGINSTLMAHPQTHRNQPKTTPNNPLNRPKINLNTATLAELESLPGVGPGLAKRIVAARQQQQFQSLDDLDNVPGVGKKLLGKLADRVSW